MKQNNDFKRDFNRARCFYLSMTLLAASVAVFAGCLLRYMPAPRRGNFRLVSAEQDGTLLVRASHGRHFRVKMYGVKLEDDWREQLRAEGHPIPRIIKLMNGGAKIIEKEGHLVYDRRCVARGKERVCFSLNVVEPDGLTPTRDQEGNILAMVVPYWHPSVCWQCLLIDYGVAHPDPAISDDPSVDHLSRSETLPRESKQK